MLLTYSLPPQFLLPSWTGPELAHAVQRSHFSGSPRRPVRISQHLSRIRITKHITGKGSHKPDASRKRSGEPFTTKAKDSNTEARFARLSPPQISCAGIRPFKPIRTAPTTSRSVRSTPVSSSVFFVGKLYDGPGTIGLKDSTDATAPSASVEGMPVESLAQNPTAEASEPADISSQRLSPRIRSNAIPFGVTSSATLRPLTGMKIGDGTQEASGPSADVPKSLVRIAPGPSVGRNEEDPQNRKAGSNPSLSIRKGTSRRQNGQASRVLDAQDTKGRPDSSPAAKSTDDKGSHQKTLRSGIKKSDKITQYQIRPLPSMTVRRITFGSDAPDNSVQKSQEMMLGTRIWKPDDTENFQRKKDISNIIPDVPPEPNKNQGNASPKEDAELEAALQKSVKSKQDPSMQGCKYLLHELVTSSSNTPAPKSLSSKERQPPSKPAEPLSLFDELFPEESRAMNTAKRESEQRLEKLPAFNWIPEEVYGDGREKERQERKAKLYTIPRHQYTRPDSAKTQFTNLENQKEHMEAQKEPDIQWRRAGVLILQACSKTLVESDFFRIGPKGNHIEGWTSGIVRVIPARDNTTLESLGHYFIIFSSDAAARSYMDNIMRIHSLWKTHGECSPFMPPPPGALRPGEDMKQLLRGFSLVPGQNRLSMRLVGRPHSPGMMRVLKQGGPPAIVEKQNNGEAIVLFSVDIGHITHFDVRRAIRDDGKRRNLHWKFTGGDVNITELKITNAVGTADNPSQELNENGRRPSTFKAPPKYLLSMKDMHEARRFVREWHRRPLDVHRDHKGLGQESPAIVNAEVLW